MTGDLTTRENNPGKVVLIHAIVFLSIMRNTFYSYLEIGEAVTASSIASDAGAGTGEATRV